MTLEVKGMFCFHSPMFSYIFVNTFLYNNMKQTLRTENISTTS